MEKEKVKDTFRLNFYFGGLQPFCGVKYFPEPVEIAVPPPQPMCVKKIMESHLANCKFKGPIHVTVFRRYVQQRLQLAGEGCAAKSLDPNRHMPSH